MKVVSVPRESHAGTCTRTKTAFMHTPERALDSALIYYFSHTGYDRLVKRVAVYSPKLFRQSLGYLVNSAPSERQYNA